MPRCEGGDQRDHDNDGDHGPVAGKADGKRAEQRRGLLTGGAATEPAAEQLRQQEEDDRRAAAGQAALQAEREEMPLEMTGDKAVSGADEVHHLDDRAVFSIFRRSSEHPLYRVEKIPALARKQGAYRVITVAGTILKRGHELATVLKVLDKPKLSVV